MNYVEFFNEYKKPVEELDLLKDFINYALEKLQLKNVMFNVIIVDNESIHKINKEYRNIDRETDVITFALEDNKQIDVPGLRVLGDVYISYDRVISQAKDYGHSTKRNMLLRCSWLTTFIRIRSYDKRRRNKNVWITKGVVR